MAPSEVQMLAGALEEQQRRNDVLQSQSDEDFSQNENYDPESLRMEAANTSKYR